MLLPWKIWRKRQGLCLKYSGCDTILGRNFWLSNNWGSRFPLILSHPWLLIPSLTMISLKTILKVTRKTIETSKGWYPPCYWSTPASWYHFWLWFRSYQCWNEIQKTNNTSRGWGYQCYFWMYPTQFVSATDAPWYCGRLKWPGCQQEHQRRKFLQRGPLQWK